MKCDDFRKLLIAGKDDDAQLAQHLHACHSCSEWLNKETAIPPQGLTPAQWQPATADCFPAKLPEATETDQANRPESFFNLYLSGLKYGLVFGLSIVTGFALLNLMKQPCQQNPALSEIEQISFIERKDEKLPDFYKNEFSDVTFFDFEESQIMSFIPEEQILDSQENEKEEEEWNEKSG